MRIVVFGAGAVGCYYGARLAMAGAAVTLVARQAHVEAITAHGLIVEQRGGVATVPVEATTTPAALADADIVLVTVKSHDTEQAAAALAAHAPPRALILSLQNGVDNAWRLRARLPHAVVPAVVYVAAEMRAPGVVQHNGAGSLVIGAPLIDDDSPAAGDAGQRLAALVSLCRRAGVPCETSPDIRVELWTKLAANCAYNALAAITGERYGVLVDRADVREVMAAVTAELVAVAQADGVPLTHAAADASVQRIADTMRDAISSTAQDLRAGRRTEIGALNGVVVERGRAYGIATPVNATLLALVRVLEERRPPPR